LAITKDIFKKSSRLDFCLTQLNLRGWQNVSDWVECLNVAQDIPCNLLIGKIFSSEDELRSKYTIKPIDRRLDNHTADKLKEQILNSFRHQLTLGVPTILDEQSLRHLSLHLSSKRLVIKLYLPAPIRQNFYLIESQNQTLRSFLGTNLTFIDLEDDESENFEEVDYEKYAHKFQERWNDRWCVDITNDILRIIEESWARTRSISPHHVYLKVAYHLSQDAIAGTSEFRIPIELKDKLFEFQKAAVQIAAKYIQKRKGVLVGDVVGLGKTRVGAVLIRMFQQDLGISTLIVCPPKLEKMWQSYVDEYGLTAKILPLSRVSDELLQEISPRFRMVLIDESHNLRNSKGKRYRALRNFILETDSMCMLLSATPYNKSFLDLSAQLGLFIPEEMNVGIRPEQLIKEMGGEMQFFSKHQCGITSFAAFEKSYCSRDWQELMRLYMVRRTRKFIKENYAEQDADGRAYLLSEGQRFYFPERIPRTCQFEIGTPANDPYARLYSDSVVDIINALNLPRYGLANYILRDPSSPPNEKESEIIEDLSRAGRRLMGFCRTNLFKRLESCGESFILSVKRHIIRNRIYLHALENDLEIPLGSQDSAIMDTGLRDADSEVGEILPTGDNYTKLTARIYDQYKTKFVRKFKWLRSDLFQPKLEEVLRQDIEALEEVLNLCPQWQASEDRKLKQLINLLTVQNPTKKILIFSQFADTVDFLVKEIKAKGIKKCEAVTGHTDDPTDLVNRFSPRSNNKSNISADQELRILISTDILSEGQNLQDSTIVVNYDLPWAIIRLIQRAGRIDRIGQESERVYCYSFLPVDGVEKIIQLRGRLLQRLQENAEVIGTDEVFFEDDSDRTTLENLYNERSGILDDDEENDVDLTSEAYQVWKNATDNDQSLRRTIESLPNFAYSTLTPRSSRNNGTVVLMQTSENNNILVKVNSNGELMDHSQTNIFRSIACEENTESTGHHPRHHELVRKAAEIVVKEENNAGGQLGGARSTRLRTYERLMEYQLKRNSELDDFESMELQRAIDELYKYPLRNGAKRRLSSLLNNKLTSDHKLVDILLELYRDGRLCLNDDESEQQEPQLICSLGIIEDGG
jgi:superfamily II DNA/RNA helicase